MSVRSSLFALTAGAGNLNLGNVLGLGIGPNLDGFIHAARFSKRI